MMKLFILLKETRENKKFIEEEILEFDFGKLKVFPFIKDDYLEIVIEGNFYIESSKNTLWVEDKNYVYLSINLEEIKRFVIKENK